METPLETLMFTALPVPISRPHNGDYSLPVPDGWELVGRQWGQPFGICGIIRKIKETKNG